MNCPAPPPATVLVAFGTRPEAIKLAPVIAALERTAGLRCVVVSSGQHAELLAPFVRLFNLRVDHDLQAMRPGQSLNALFARILTDLDPLLEQHKPAAVLVQGDTTTAAAAAVAAFHRGIPVGHVEAGLRTGDLGSPFPEEANRRLIGRLARWHFAATRNHARTLLREGVPRSQVFRTGNPVVDALEWVVARGERSDRLRELLSNTAGLKRVAVTTHRRESFGGRLEANLRVLRRFVERHADTAVIFPVHPNPAVRELANAILGGVDRVHLTDPLDYPDFIGLLSEAWVIASDSGGVQEEAPSLGKPLFVLRESTERPEVLDTGLAKLCPTAEAFADLLDEAYRTDAAAKPTDNPFGDGRAGGRIARLMRRELGRCHTGGRPSPTVGADSRRESATRSAARLAAPTQMGAEATP